MSTSFTTSSSSPTTVDELLAHAAHCEATGSITSAELFLAYAIELEEKETA